MFIVIVKIKMNFFSKNVININLGVKNMNKDLKRDNHS